jgi:DNA-binding transcriptional LysR family regulator
MHATVLRYFDQVARLGSIRQAATAANVAASAVTRQIMRLEAEVGAPLFERLRRGVRLTPAGEILWQHVRETMTDWHRIRGEIHSLRGSLSGDVRIVSIEAMLMVFLAEAIAQTGRAHPHLTFTVNAADPSRIVDDLQTGQSDFGVLWIDKRNRHFEIVQQVEARLGAVVPADHPLATRATVTLADCAAYPIVTMPNLWALTAIAEVEFSKSGARFAPRIRTSSFAFARRMMIEGIGIGIFLPFGFRDDIESGVFRHVPLAEPQFRNNYIGLVKLREKRLSPAARLALGAVAEHMKPAAGWAAAAPVAPPRRRTPRR